MLVVRSVIIALLLAVATSAWTEESSVEQRALGFAVRARVIPNCRVLTGALDFGNSTEAATEIAVSCTRNSVAVLQLGAFAARQPQMTSSVGAGMLYALCQDATCLQPWDVLFPVRYTSIDADRPGIFPVFGRIPADRPLPADHDGRDVTASIDF
jgi:spore coat protein U-like protein